MGLKELISLIKNDPTALSLLASNLISIILAVLFNWPLLVLLFSFWIQSVIIGFFQFLKILSIQDYSAEGVEITVNKKPVKINPDNSKFFFALFFAFHYGLFHLVYFFFLAFFAFFSFIESIAGNAPPSIGLIDFFWIALMGLIFFFSHLYSFNYHKNEFKTAKYGMKKVFSAPYARIIPMHLTIILGGFVFFQFNSIPLAQKALLALFLLLKTAADLAMHLNEHKEFIQEKTKN